jgi:hypothetical protein
MAEKSKDITFATGGIVKLVGLNSKAELNGLLGAIRKISNGRFQIMPTFGKNDLCVKKANLEKLDKTDSLLGTDQCPNELRCGTKGIMIWPYIKEVNGIPSMNWVETDKLQHAITPFDTDYSKESWKIAINTPGCPTIMMSEHFDSSSIFGNVLESRLKVGIEFVETKCDVNEMKMVEPFNWTTPIKWLCNAYTGTGHLGLKLCFIYDKDSQGPVNDWATHIFALPWLKGSNVFPKIRGPFLYFRLQPDIDGNWAQKNNQTLNGVKRLLYVQKNFGFEINHQKKACKSLRAMPNCTEPCVHCRIRVMEHLCDKVCGTQYTVRTAKMESVLEHQETEKVFNESFRAYNDWILDGKISDDPKTLKLAVFNLRTFADFSLPGDDIDDFVNSRDKRFPPLVRKVLIAWCTSDLLSHSTEIKLTE